MLIIKGEKNFQLIDVSLLEATYIRNIFKDRYPLLTYYLSLPDNQLRMELKINTDTSIKLIRESIQAEYDWLEQVIEQFSKYE